MSELQELATVVASVLGATLRISVPLVLCALAGVLSERAGVIASFARGVEQRRHQAREHAEVAQQRLRQRRREGADEEAQPDVIQNQIGLQRSAGKREQLSTL